MNEVIKNICQALKEEADAVISYTEKMESTLEADGAQSTAQRFEVIRMDEVEHIQNLCLELTKLVAATAESGEADNREGYQDRTAELAIAKVYKEQKAQQRKEGVVNGSKRHSKTEKSKETGLHPVRHK